MRTLRLFVFLLLTEAAVLASTAAIAHAQAASAQPGQALVDAALANELTAAQDLSHPMRYLLRKSSPRLTATRQICETREGDVARLIEENGRPLSAADEQKELARLTELAGDPARQRHRKQAEDADRARALKVLRVLPRAFLYQDTGPAPNPAPGPAGTPAGTTAGTIEKFAFRPNPAFSPPDLETQVLTAMAGELWIDPAQQRVVRLEAHVQQDVDFGWGILGRLNKGGWIRIDQADVGGGQWRTVRLQMAMSGRVVFKPRSFDTDEEESQFAPLPATIAYREAIAMLEAEAGGAR